MSDLNQLIPAFQAIGLEVNQLKCELITLDETQENIAVETEPAHNSRLSAALQLFQTASQTPLVEVTLLGAPIKPDVISESLSLIKTTTDTLIEKTSKIGIHLALFFLSHYASVPRSIYLMCSAPIYMAPVELQGINTMLCEAISRCCNVQLNDDAWTQASLPLRLGGIGT
ncbi:hypothetical protein Pcinc_016294 [Petrolisthes cinctipes]|uniref:Uncharacterized protein n=1 Tax=Petrolisthes cinctipes TaxID=88211 RepID=A0AAE1FT50_PETCI|nr:hypothetical protein Pcinc_033790 [Petrolisthes cinctipes]KAK3879110.1 hypothetical protein Pcinc_016269 [Petrolisthes cinctipes]KAK3879135.1 hypothetical protein Pcinc_016294 [Petrolisthes cinctipes]